MKSTILAAAILYFLTGPAAVLAEAPAVTVKPFAVKVVPVDVAPTAQQAVAEAPLEEGAAGSTTTSRKPCPMQGMGKMRKRMGQDGKGPGCRKPGCDRDGSGQQGKHGQVVRRLDMIEARIAKMEAML